MRRSRPILAGGKKIEHLELRRNDEVDLNALGAVRIPDPTTAGDFCRRFAEHDVVRPRSKITFPKPLPSLYCLAENSPVISGIRKVIQHSAQYS